MIFLAASKTTINVSNDVIAESISTAINAVHQSCLVNTDMINRYEGGSLPTIDIDGKPVLLTFGAIHAAQMSLMTDGHMAPKLTRENTEHVVNQAFSKLWTSIPATVQVLVERKTELGAAGLAAIVKNSLDLLLHNHEIVGHAVAAKFDQTDKRFIETMQNQGKEVADKILDGIALFHCDEAK